MVKKVCPLKFPPCTSTRGFVVRIFSSVMMMLCLIGDGIKRTGVTAWSIAPRTSLWRRSSSCHYYSSTRSVVSKNTNYYNGGAFGSIRILGRTFSHNHSPFQKGALLPKRQSLALFSSFSSSSVDKTTLEQELGEARRSLASVVELYHENVASTTPHNQLLHRKADLEREQSDPAFWDDNNQARAAVVNTQLGETTRMLQRLESWQQWKDDATTALELWAEERDPTERAVWFQEYTTAMQKLDKDSQAYQLELLLSGPYDSANARVVLTAGAGGTEANDWVADLKRMYQRHLSSREGYTVTVEDEQPGDQVGYKTVEMLVTGPNAYGWLQGEKGAHRLVRLSPFNANNKRQTTFAGVDVAPDILQDEESLQSLEIPESELEITTMRSGGKGGQNVNKVESAVRIKHLPTGLQVKCTAERVQSRNKDIAMTRLKAQLLAIMQEQRLADYQQIRGDMVEASWGAQIRNYVLHPYKLVKDQRTGWETANTQAFLDGDLLEDCIGEFLRWKAAKAKEEAEEKQRGG